MGRVIYMDHHATTPVDPRVLEAMLPYFTEKFGNAGSRNHAYGWEAEEACDRARRQVASVIGARPREIVFTSGATESINLAIKGVVEFYRDRGNHVLTAATEHEAVLDTCKTLEKEGKAKVTCIPVDADGLVDPDDVRRAITSETILVSIMHANNEIGTVNPIAEVGRIAKERGVLFHTDATQSVGKLPVDAETMAIDLMSFSAHKIYGPKGCGALFVRSGKPPVRIVPQIDGGGQERGMRSGTLNVPGIVGFGRACELAGAEMEVEQARLLRLRERLRDGLLRDLDHLRLNGHPLRRLAGSLNVSFAFVEAESLMLGIKEVAVSSGSACTSATLKPSHVLRALGLDDELARSSIRFGLGRFNTDDEVDYVIGRVAEEVRRLRALSPRYRA